MRIVYEVITLYYSSVRQPRLLHRSAARQVRYIELQRRITVMNHRGLVPRPMHKLVGPNITGPGSPLILEARFFFLTTTAILHILHRTHPPPHLTWMHRRQARQSHMQRLATRSHPSIQQTTRRTGVSYPPKSQKRTATIREIFSAKWRYYYS